MLIPDLSEWNVPWDAPPDLPGIKRQNGGAVIIRAGYGPNRKDRAFDRLRQQAHDAGFLFTGIYHFTVPWAPVAGQAAAFCGWVGDLQPGEVLINDLEGQPDGDPQWPAGDLSPVANEWARLVDAHYGLDKLALARRSWLYTGDYFGRAHGLASICDTARSTWVAAYGPSPPALAHILWQCTNGTDGVNITSWAGCGKVDTSVTSLTLPELAALAYQPGGTMPLTQADLDAVFKAVWQTDGKVPSPPDAPDHAANPFWWPESYLTDIDARVRKIEAAVTALAALKPAPVDVQALADAVLAALPPGLAQDVAGDVVAAIAAIAAKLVTPAP